jgi:hypothetical protein
MKGKKIAFQVAFILLTSPIIGLIWKPLKSLLNTFSCPNKKVQVEKLALLEEQKMVWLIDYLLIHKSKTNLGWMKLKFPKMCVIFILANCIGILQPNDVILQCPFKDAFMKDFHSWTYSTIKSQLKR